MLLGTLVRGLGVCQVFESVIGNREKKKRSNCEGPAAWREVVRVVVHKSRVRLDQVVKVGITAAVNFGWYSNAVRRTAISDTSGGSAGD